MPAVKRAPLACVQHAVCCRCSRCSRCLKMSLSPPRNPDSSQSRALLCLFISASTLLITPVEELHPVLPPRSSHVYLGATLKASPSKSHSTFCSVLCLFAFILSSLFFGLCLHRTETFCSCKPARAEFSFRVPCGDCEALHGGLLSARGLLPWVCIGRFGLWSLPVLWSLCSLPPPPPAISF